MKYTIKDLSEGRVAVINDGTLEQLKQVLGKAFPNSNQIPIGVAAYYLASTRGKVVCISTDTKPNIPIQSVKDFLEELSVPKEGEVVLVRNSDLSKWLKRIYLGTIARAIYPYITYAYNKHKQYSEIEPMPTFCWKQMKRIEVKPKETTLTMDQIAEKFGIPVEQLKVIK